MDNKKYNFINTTDAETANTLRQLGFHELPKQGNRWVFINENNKVQFSSDDMKLNFTNMLTF